MVSICKSCHLSTPFQMVNAECKLSLILFQISCCLSCYSSHNLQHGLNIVQTTIPLLSIDLSSLSPLSFCSWLARHFTMFVLLLCLLPFLIDLSILYFFPLNEICSQWNLLLIIREILQSGHRYLTIVLCSFASIGSSLVFIIFFYAISQPLSFK